MKSKCNCHPESRQWDKEEASRITQAICETYSDKQAISHIEERNLPQYKEVINILLDLMEIIFPGYSGRYEFNHAGLEYSIGELVNNCQIRLTEQITRALQFYCEQNNCQSHNCHQRATNTSMHLLESIPAIREMLKSDVAAAMAGDPAAMSLDEVVISYPGFKAIAAFRLAHVLYEHDIPLLPRIMTEHAHHETGVDIHPGATVGHHFFIDHGPGVVIGETAIIGNHVKVYQGVTLGALSFPTDENGIAIKGTKRHPSIEDNVTIYAGATILGDITLGEGSMIGGNVWLTESIEPHSRVTIATPKLTIKTRKK